MADFLGVNLAVPDINTALLSGSTLTWIAIFFMFVLVVTISVYLIYMMRLYSRKIIVFENISGQGFQPFYKDKARLIKIGDGGEEVLFLRKKKVYRTAYGRKMGKNTYWFAVGQDGYWYNVTLGDLDAKMGMLDIEPIDRDMRYMHVAIRKNIEKNYNRQKFMEKYGVVIMNSIFLLIMLAGLWLLIDKIAGLVRDLGPLIDASRLTSEKLANILGSLDNICSGGSGITEVI